MISHVNQSLLVVIHPSLAFAYVENHDIADIVFSLGPVYYLHVFLCSLRNSYSFLFIPYFMPAIDYW